MFIRLRRIYQALFLALFLFLVVVTTAGWIKGYPVEWFLAVDPLAAVSTALANRSLHATLAWALPLIVITLVFGRFFCGWICPMGVLHHALGWMGRKRRLKERIDANASRPAQALKYVVLVVMLGAALAGSVQIGLLDPIATMWRALSTSLLPAASNTALGLYQGERHFQWSTLIVVLFLVALGLNFVFARFYCRVLCPLGGLLGLLSRFALFRIARKPEACNGCKQCVADCQGAASPEATVKTAECMLCLNCIESCPKGALVYRFLPAPELATGKVDLGKRRWMTAAVAGVATVPLMRASDGVEPRPDPRRIRPPGAWDEPEFLSRCLKCGACMKACPTGGLQPAMFEAGLEGLWTPVLVPRLGDCEHGCVLCGQVCPTGAIRKLTLAEKTGEPPHEEPIRIGSAAIDRGRCLPWANDTECIVCEEVCPTSPKAIYVKLETVTLRDGTQKVLKRPQVDLSKCVGCGTCEKRCPVFDQAAIRVRSVGETRSAVNRVMLGGKV